MAAWTPKPVTVLLVGDVVMLWSGSMPFYVRNVMGFSHSVDNPWRVELLPVNGDEWQTVMLAPADDDVYVWEETTW